MFKMYLNKLAEDTITKGIFAGIVGGIIMTLVNFLLYFFKIITLRTTDTIVLVYHHKAQTLVDDVTGFIIHIFFVSLAGIILAYILKLTDYRFPYLKGFFLTLGINITLFLAASFAKLETIINSNPLTFLILNFNSAIFLGIPATFILIYINKNYKKSFD